MPIGIDIFSGAGGLSLGAEMAGFEIRYAVRGLRTFEPFIAAAVKISAVAIGLITFSRHADKFFRHDEAVKIFTVAVDNDGAVRRK